jgi:Holliday junction resolvase
MESLIKKTVELEGEEKEILVELLANHMKKSYLAWNKDGVDDDKIFQDLKELSKGKLNISKDEIQLADAKSILPPKQKKKKFKKK